MNGKGLQISRLLLRHRLVPTTNRNVHYYDATLSRVVQSEAMAILQKLCHINRLASQAR